MLEKYGKLTVIKKIVSGVGENYECQCDCGNIVTLMRCLVTSGRNKSCGCLHKTDDISGKKFGFLTVIEEIKKGKYKYAICICDCGNKKDIHLHHLKNGKTVSCGCYKPHKKAFGESLKNHALRECKYSAIKRNLKLELIDDDILFLITQKCYYCGDEPNRVIKRDGHYGEFICHGIDRKNNDIGYTKDNSVTCCKKCNYMKVKLSEKDFVNQCIKISKYINGDK